MVELSGGPRDGRKVALPEGVQLGDVMQFVPGGVARWFDDDCDEMVIHFYRLMRGPDGDYVYQYTGESR
jgi:hypothetical protein